MKLLPDIIDKECGIFYDPRYKKFAPDKCCECSRFNDLCVKQYINKKQDLLNRILINIGGK